MADNKNYFSSVRKMWFAISILSISTFTIVTAELAPIGLLTPMAEGLGQSESMIGVTVSVYAWIGAFCALLSSVLLGGLPRKRLLIFLMSLLLISNIVCATSETYSTLVVARIIGAIAHGAFWAMIGAFTMSLVPEDKIGLATSIVFGGVSAASVFGVPIVSTMAQFLTWQSSFLLIALLCLIALLGILAIIPTVPTSGLIGIKALKSIIQNKNFLMIYFVTFIGITAHFCGFTYIEPFLSSEINVGSNWIPIALFAFGVAGIIGNFITGILIDKYRNLVLLGSFTLSSVSLLFLGSFEKSLPIELVLCFVVLWGITTSGIFIGLQTWVLTTAKQDAFPASAIYVGIFNAAIGSGAFFGAWIVSKFSLSLLMTVAGICIFITVPVIGLYTRKLNVNNLSASEGNAI
ncbi:MFS transporter [Microbulbifer sp. 2205BS26-8]|uniref:MFS transporter n=1 Tax=Microbulbifer sp. 2205BS26-8 TaxID=3064386 RepID=UPI00273E619A|nr:MFS transporter [Microbulbifer sp. 2205BS26-8]MDP5211010.1 MFS transporter [Microbulbifer sp. 2205BS26-8]